MIIRWLLSLAALLILAGCFDSDSSSGTGNTVDNPDDVGVTMARVSVAVVDDQGIALPDASVTTVRDTSAGSAGVNIQQVTNVEGPEGITDADGRYSFEIANDATAIVRVSRSGHTEQTRRIVLPAGASAADFEVALRRLESPVELANAESGGSVSGVDGVGLEVPAGALVDANGNVITGAVDIYMSPVDVTDERAVRAFPGEFQGIDENDNEGLLASFGVADYRFFQDGQELELAEGQTATVRIPLYVGNDLDGTALIVGASIPLWSLDETTGIWQEEGFGTVVGEPDSPTGFVLEGEVGHFSPWNADKLILPESDPPSRIRVRIFCGSIETLCDPQLPPIRVEVHAGEPGRPWFSRNYIVPVGTGGTFELGPEVTFEVFAEGLDSTFAAEVVPGNTFSLTPGELREVDIVLVPLNETKETFLPGSRLRGEMTDIGETHDFLFAVRPGESFSVAAFAAENLFSPVGRSGQLGGLLSVLDGQGNVLGSEPFDAFQDARIDLNVTAAGTWSVRIEAEGKVPGFYVATTGLRPLQVRREYIKPAVLTGGFGEQIAMDGRTLVVNNAGGGAVGVFERDSELGWLQIDELLGEGQINSFGQALDIDADTVVVGDPFDSSRKLDGSSIKCNFQSSAFAIFEGAAYVFRRANDGSWNPEACLKEPGTLGDGNFGRRVAVSGNTLAVGHPDEPLLENNTNVSDAGAVHLYVRDSNDEWSFQATLRSPLPRRQGKLGGDGLDLDGDTLVVSEQAGFDSSGQQLPPAIHVFERSNDSWSLVDTFAGSDGTNVGVEAIAIDGDVFVAGVPRESTAQANLAGAVFVYEREGGGWSGPAILEAPLPGGGDRFGAALDLDGKDLIVGAPGEASGNAEDTSDNSLRDAGAAYRARRDPDGSWIFTDYVKAIDIDRDDFFGEAVALGTDSIAIGASKDDGVEGDPTDDSAPDTGAVYTAPR